LKPYTILNKAFLLASLAKKEEMWFIFRALPEK
jgi:hypothetical protein